MNSWTFTTAIAVFAAERAPEDETARDEAEAAERYLLTTKPTTTTEARAVIAALLHNVETGPRADGADVLALLNLEQFLAGPKIVH